MRCMHRILLTSLYDVQCALLANSAGIGGGPFYVPLLTVVLGFDLKAATGLSHTIVGKPATSAAGSTGMRVKLLQTYSDCTLQSAARASSRRTWPGCMHVRVCHPSADMPHHQCACTLSRL